MEKIETDILILGAGWSGLVAADHLSRRERSTVILEKDSEVGGLAKTFDFNGFRFDIGGHGLFFENPENLAYIKSNANHNGLITLERKVRILFDNKYIDYPPNLSSVLSLNKKSILNILFDMFRLKGKRRKSNFEEWVKSNYGEYLYKIYFKDYTEKVWGMPCSKLSAGWAEKRIGSSNLPRLIKSILTGEGYCKENKRLFHYPREGIGLLPSLLERKAKNNNCRIYKNSRLKQCSIKDNKLRSLSFVSDNRQYEVFFKKIISSIPLAELIRIFPRDVASSAYRDASSIKYRNLILVSLIIDKKLTTDWHWCYFPSNELPFSRIHEPKFWSQNMASEDKTLLCAEIFCNYSDMYWGMNDEELIKKVKHALPYTGIVNNSDCIVGACVKKIEYAYPLHYGGFENPLNRVRDFLGTFNNLWLIGRNGTHSYSDMEECLENARGVARAVDE